MLMTVAVTVTVLMFMMMMMISVNDLSLVRCGHQDVTGQAMWFSLPIRCYVLPVRSSLCQSVFLFPQFPSTYVSFPSPPSDEIIITI